MVVAFVMLLYIIIRRSVLDPVTEKRRVCVNASCVTCIFRFKHHYEVHVVF